MKADLYYLDNHLNITQANWDQLKKDGRSAAFLGVVAAAKVTVEQGGAFIVYCEVTGEVQRRCDRQTELDDEISA